MHPFLGFGLGLRTDSLNNPDDRFVDFIAGPGFADTALFEKVELEHFFAKDTESLALSGPEQVPRDQWMSVELNRIPSCRVSEFDQREDKFLLFFRPELDVEYRRIEKTRQSSFNCLRRPHGLMNRVKPRHN